LASLVEQVKTLTEGKRFCKNLKIAVMGCVVNGPGEAGECDFGIAGGKEQSILFKNGEKFKVIKNDCIMPEMQQLLMEYYEKD
jgi:(E)-4-hydroxy-3-methylbut-2-enyl-diphosphate synthase